MAKTTVTFEVEKETKNTYKFKEVVAGPLDTTKIGTLYVPKSTLKEIGYNPGEKLAVDIYPQK